MRIRGFIDEYCSDILAEVKKRESLLDSEDFTFDAEVEEPDGTRVKIIYAGDEEIPIADILAMDKNDFIKIHSSLQAQKAYDDYVDSIIMLEGEEALLLIRNEMIRERSRIESFTSFTDSLW